VTPVPLDLPVRPPEAAELARLIFQQAEGKRLNDDLRSRVASRGAQLRLESIRPWFGSLSREPIHHSTYYLAVDTADGAPLLLHMAPPAAPTSGVFPKPLLIGRFADVVINAVPFGACDRENIAAFVARIDPSFAPRPQGMRPAIAVGAGLPAAFDALRAVLRRAGKNLAATCGVDLAAAQWYAIRAGWREGFSAGIELTGGMDEMREGIRQNAGMTHFAVTAPTLEDAAHLHEFIRQTRSAAKLPRPFDFELSLASSAAPTRPADLRAALEFLKAAGHAPQWIEPRLQGFESVEELAGIARLYQCGLSLRAGPEHDAAALDALARATGGRFYYKVITLTEDARARVEFLAAHLA
jgi:hypothetical protein